MDWSISAAPTLWSPRTQRWLAAVLTGILVGTAVSLLPKIAGARAPRPATFVTAPGPDGTTVTGAVVRADGTGPHRTVLILPGTDGFRWDYVDLARSYADEGMDAVVGCWFDRPPGLANLDLISCGSDAPAFTGVSEATVPVVDALVRLALDTTGADLDRLAVLGYSRGGGAAALWAARTGAAVPIVTLAGMVTGTNAFPETVTPEERGVNVVASASSIRAPMLVLHDWGDSIVPRQQAIDLHDALAAAGGDVTLRWYRECGDDVCNHDFIDHGDARRDIVATSVTWIDAHTA